MKGRRVNLDVKITDGRIQDVLRLAVKAKKPVMVGRIALQAKLLLPPGQAAVIDRLDLDGRFVLENAHFTDAGVQEQLAIAEPPRAGKEARPIPSAPSTRTCADGSRCATA